MFKILAADSNIKECKEIINFISKNNSKLKLHSMAYSGTEAMELITGEDADLILLDLQLTDATGIEIINRIESDNIIKYRNSIILIGDNACRGKSQYIYKYFQRPLKLEKINETIKNLVTEREIRDNEIVNKIEKELHKLNFNFRYKGTRYVIESIYEIYINQFIEYDNLSKNIYPIIAKRHNKSVDTIYGDIKQAVNAMYYDCDEDIIKEYFKYKYIVKPKQKEVIFSVLKKLY